MGAGVAYEFGPFRLEPGGRRLLRDGQAVVLTPKAFDILVVLVESWGRVVGKDEMLQLVWPDTVVEEANLTQHVFLLRKALDDAPDPHRYVTTVPRRGYQFVAPVRELPVSSETGRADERTASTPRSLAVMPFTFLGAHGADEYLGLGLADALITRLGNVRQIAVRPTGSVRRYAGTAWDPVQAGRELGVDAVLEGYIQRSSDRVRLTVQLIDVRTGSPLWGERLDEPFADMFTVQDAIAERAAESLALRLTTEERGRLRRRYTADAEAHHAYLRGRFHWHKRTLEGMQRAVEHFRQAIERDPAYALAHAGLADAELFLGGYFGVMPLREAVARARAAARRALEVDDELPEAHASMGVVELFDWNWEAADRHLERSVLLNPSYATAHNWRAGCLMGVGRTAEALAAAERALQADPLSLVASMGVAHYLCLVRQPERAIEQVRKTLEMDNRFYMAWWVLSLAHEQMGSMTEAVAAAERASELSGGSPVMTGFLGRAYGLAGRREAVRALFAQNARESPERRMSAECVAWVHASLGELDAAFEWLFRACDDRSFSFVYYLKAAPLYDGLRSDPRFAEILRRVGLVP